MEIFLQFNSTSFSTTKSVSLNPVALSRCLSVDCETVRTLMEPSILPFEEGYPVMSISGRQISE